MVAFILLTSFFGIYLQAQNSIFDRNIFDGIASSPEFYEKDSNFSVIKNMPDSGGYAWRSNADLESVVKNEEIEIYYWRINGIYRIQLVVVSKNTDNSIWGKYIGKNKDEILNMYKSYRNISDKEIEYVSNDWEYFIRFELLNNKIVAITFGHNI
jgi:hypothetical protein